MGGRRAAATVAALLLVAGCGSETAGSATVNSGAAVVSPAPTITTPRPPPAGPGPAGTAAGSSATSPPSVVTTTVTTVTTAAPATPADPPATTAPADPSTDLAGEVHGFLTAVDVAGATVTVDKIDWFTGADARRACAEDGVTDTSNNWCTGYYWRNRNPALRTVAVSPDAVITVLDGSASAPASLARVGQRIVQANSTYLLVVTDGRVTELHEMYAP